MNHLRRIEKLEAQIRADEALNDEMETLWNEWCSLATEEEIEAFLQEMNTKFCGGRSPHALETASS